METNLNEFDVIIANDGRILKGLNKLEAICETGVGQKLSIVIDVDPDDFECGENLSISNN